MTLADLNALAPTARAEALATCCGSSAWVAALSQQFPFATAEALYAEADR
ncbi:MAG: OHCU decarboxylase, partial [Hymenobacter sp.]